MEAPANAEVKLKDIISKGTPAPVYESWSDAEERRLIELMTKPIYIGDTALGRKRQVKKMELNATIGCMSKEERDELRKKLKTADEMEVNEVPAAPSVAIRPNLGRPSIESTQATVPSPEAITDGTDVNVQLAAI